MKFFISILIFIFIFALLILFLNYTLRSLGFSILFKKVFKEKQWKAFIPIYNDYLICKNINCVEIFLLNILLILILTIIQILNKNLNINIILYIISFLILKSYNVILEYFLSKNIGQSKFLFILSIFVPNLIFFINGLSYEERDCNLKNINFNLDYNIFNKETNNYNINSSNSNSGNDIYKF